MSLLDKHTDIWTTSSSSKELVIESVVEEESYVNDDDYCSDLSSLDDDVVPAHVLDDDGDYLCLNGKFVDMEPSFVGHCEERSILKESFERIGMVNTCTENDDNNDVLNEEEGVVNASECVVIRGGSGVGKSYLLQNIRNEFLAENPNCLFVVGDFDQFRNDPFSAIVSAFTDLVDLILQSCPQRGQQICQQLQDHQLQKQDFIQVISSLQRLRTTNTTNTNKNHSNPNPLSTTEAFKRFKVNAPLFLRALSNKDHPIVFCLDDVQHADAQSKHVIKSLWRDKASKYILHISLYRDDDNNAYDTRKFFRFSSSLRIQKLKLDNLNQQQTRHMIQNILHLNSTTITTTQQQQNNHEPFIQTIIQRTDGNPQRILQFLDMLRQESLLWYDQTQPQPQNWQWDLTEIQQSSLDLSVVQDKVARLGRSVQSILSIASFLGSDFHESVLQIIIEEYAQTPSLKDQSKMRVKQTLHQALEEGLVERINGGHFRFKPNVQHVLYNLIQDEAQRDQLHLMIGRYLSKAGAPLLLTVADHLNRGSSQLQREEERVDLANINLEAAKLAITKSSARRRAMDYLKNGVSILNASNSMWQEHYQLSVELCSNAAQMTYMTGDFDDADEMISTILENTSGVNDRIRVYQTKVNLSLARGKIEEAIRVAIETLDLLDEKCLPKQPKKIKSALAAAQKTVKRLLSKQKPEQIAALPIMKDENTSNVCKMLAEISKACTFGGNPLLGTLASTRLVELTLLHGLNKYSPEGFIRYAVSSDSTQYDFASLAHTIIMDERLNAQDWLSRVHTASYPLLIHRKTPLRDCLDPLQKAYDQCMDSEFVGFAGINTALIQFHCGMPLTLVEESFRELVKRMKNLKQENLVFLAVPYWQMVMNFMGHTEHAVKLNGRAMNEDEFLLQARDANHEIGIVTCRFVSLILSLHFGALVQAEEAVDELQNRFQVEQKLVGHFQLYYYQFYAGLTYVQMAHKSGLRKYKKKANAMIKCLSKNKSCPNIVPLIQFLKAEQTKNNADQLIAAFGKIGGTMEAFAKERLGLRLIELGDATRAKTFLERAQVLYGRWGGEAKASYLKRKLLQIGKY